MFTKFKRKSSMTLFLDPLSTMKVEYPKGEKVNIILSPSLYWVKKLILPVRYVREVKKLLPSIFEEILPSGHYSYSAYKQGEEFYIFAYEDKKIIDLLSQNEINSADINKVYFAQSELSSIDAAKSINEKQTLYVKDDILLVTPNIWFDEVKPLDLSQVIFSNNAIKLQQYGHIVENSSLYKIGAMLGFLAFLLIFEIFVTTQKRDAILESKDELFSKYKLQSTMMQNLSTTQKYEKIHQTQSMIREIFSYFLTMKLQKNQKIALMEYKNGVLSVVINGVEKGNEKNITSQLDANKVKYASSLNDSSLKLEMKI